MSIHRPNIISCICLSNCIYDNNNEWGKKHPVPAPLLHFYEMYVDDLYLPFRHQKSQSRHFWLYSPLASCLLACSSGNALWVVVVAEKEADWGKMDEGVETNALDSSVNQREHFSVTISRLLNSHRKMSASQLADYLLGNDQTK